MVAAPAAQVKSGHRPGRRVHRRGVRDDRAIVQTWDVAALELAEVVRAKASRLLSVCIPAHDEAPTVARVVRAVAEPHLAAAGGSGLVDEVLVVDDGSADGTGAAAACAGARVVRLGRRNGKGAAMRAALEHAAGDFLVFLDADVLNTSAAFVTNLAGPLLLGDAALVKGYYRRPLDGAPTGGGRVNELMARPVIEVLFPELAGVRQPLAGETAAPRWVLEKVGLSDGYGVEMGLLLDVARLVGAERIAQVDLGERHHRNRSLEELRPQAAEVLRAALARAAADAGPGSGGPARR